MDVMVTVSTDPTPIYIISPNPLAASHVSFSYSPPCPCPKCHHMSIVNHYNVLEGNVFDYMQPLGTFRGYYPFLDPYSLYLGNMPVKILFTIAFNHSIDFSKEFNKFPRALTIISEFMFKCSYSHSTELHAQVFDKLMRALTASELAAWVVRRGGVANALRTSHSTVLRR